MKEKTKAEWLIIKHIEHPAAQHLGGTVEGAHCVEGPLEAGSVGGYLADVTINIF